MKPKILITPLCGMKRGRWLNPQLFMSLLNTIQDERFEVTVSAAYNTRPADHCRNICTRNARDHGFDWLVLVDNDQTVPNLLDIVAEAGPDQDIIGLCSGTLADG